MRLVAAVIIAVFCIFASGGDGKADSLWTTEIERAFSVRDVESKSLVAFINWRAVLERSDADEARSAGLCGPASAAPECVARRQRAEFLKSLRGLSATEQLAAVHAYVDRTRWVDDRQNYGVPDYWATPDEFFVRGGDCEDFAVAKRDALRRLGFADAQMRIMVLSDLKLRQPHAVLLVLVDSHLWVLDNNLRAIVPASAIRHYDPIYSINESGWWLHRPAIHDVDSAGRRR